MAGSKQPARQRKRGQARARVEATERSPAPPSRHRPTPSEARHDEEILAAARALQGRMAAHLLKLRAARGLTQEQAAEAARVSVKLISRAEHGTANLTLVVLVALARAYGVTVRELLG